MTMEACVYVFFSQAESALACLPLDLFPLLSVSGGFGWVFPLPFLFWFCFVFWGGSGCFGAGVWLVFLFSMALVLVLVGSVWAWLGCFWGFSSVRFGLVCARLRLGLGFVCSWFCPFGLALAG